jgi:3',5'-cyclic AMP phosphodiesterase CpdA
MRIAFSALRRVAVIAALTPSILGAQATPLRDSVASSMAPKNPLPSEPSSAGVHKFSFIAYGDTRGRHDGVELQAEHTLVIESMLATIKRSANTADPIRFVLQSGDAVNDGSKPLQWTVSYIPLINRLTQDAGVPYFLSMGNHDVGNSTDLKDLVVSRVFATRWRRTRSSFLPTALRVG